MKTDEMMKIPSSNREAFEQQLGIDPRNPELRDKARALAAGDESCMDLEWQLARGLQWDNKLVDSLNRLATPPMLAADILRHVDANSELTAHKKPVAKSRRSWIMGAAAAAVVAFASSAWWVSNDINSKMARECAEHMSHEPFALTKTQPVPQALLDRALEYVGFNGAMPANVTYAMPCPINGQQSLHTVIASAHGPVTVFVFTNGAKQWRSDEIHHHGSVVRTSPHANGAFVLVAESNAAFNEIEAALLAAAG
jgi:hypothetical protein